MVAPASDYRPLLGGGLWLVGSAAVAAFAYSIGGGSSIASALSFEYFLVAAAVWIARDLHQKRDFPAIPTDSAPSETLPGDQGLASLEPVHGAIQSRAAILTGVAAVVGLFALLQLLQLSANETLMADDDLVTGIVCLALTFVWLVMARSFQSIREVELPEAPPLMAAFREAQWITSLAAVGLIGASIEPLLTFWATRLIFLWILAICLETVLRQMVGFLIPSDAIETPVAPIDLLLRESIFTASNPVASLVRTFENRCGVSLRSSWAIAFVRNATIPLLIFLMFLCWGLTSLVIVETNQMAVREHFGRVVGNPLRPGLHVMLPWPFGRIRTFPVKTVQQVPIGYVETEESLDPNQPRALLWTKPHAKEEFALVLGDGSELVAVNALVYFKISEAPDEFLDYVYQQSAPEEALTAFAYRALMEQTRGRTLDDVLSVNRADFARRVANSIRQQSKAARLGLEVVDLALLNLHPPIEAAAAYLDVINARLDARRRVTEAEGDKQVALLEASMRGTMAVAAARIEGSRRVAGALSDNAEFKAVGEALQASPRTLRLRLWIESLESALADQRLFLVDHTWLDGGGEMILDSRPQDGRRLPELDAPSPFPLPGPNPK